MKFAHVLQALAAKLDVRSRLPRRRIARDGRAFVLRRRAARSAEKPRQLRGLQCDRSPRMAGVDPELTIVPFRGEYYDLVEARRSLCRHLIYPVPDPRYPFLGVT